MARYLPAWSNPIVQPPPTPGAPQVPNPDPAEGNFLQDAGMRVVALSRWNNYYVAGLAQIQRDYAADGIYLDEIACVFLLVARCFRILAARVHCPCSAVGTTERPCYARGVYSVLVHASITTQTAVSFLCHQL